MNDENIPVVRLPGSEAWEDAYEAAKGLDRLFREQDAWDFIMCINYNDRGPIADDWSNIAKLKCVQYGENDEGSWIWEVVLTDGEDGQRWQMEGWCDYTGWDCQSGNRWLQQ